MASLDNPFSHGCGLTDDFFPSVHFVLKVVEKPLQENNVCMKGCNCIFELRGNGMLMITEDEIYGV